MQEPYPVRASAGVDTSDLIQVARSLKRSLTDLRPVWRQAGTVMRRSFAENFRQGGRPVRWKPLSPNTIAQKELIGAAAGFPYATPGGRLRVRRLQQLGNRSLSNILIARGDLRDSYVQKNGDHISRVNHEGFEEGSKHWLAPIHEEGTSPYTIYPKRARRLRFATARGMAYARSVKHPGVPPRPVAIVQPEDEERIMQLLEDHLV